MSKQLRNIMQQKIKIEVSSSVIRLVKRPCNNTMTEADEVKIYTTSSSSKKYKRNKV